MVNLNPVDAEITASDHLQLISYLKLFHLADTAFVTISAGSNYLSVYFDNHPTEFRWSKPAEVVSSNSCKILAKDILVGYKVLKTLGVDKVKYHLTLDDSNSKDGMGYISFYVQDTKIATNKIDIVLPQDTENKDISLDDTIQLNYFGDLLRRYKPLYRKASSQSANLIINTKSGYLYTDFWESDYNSQEDSLNLLLYPVEWDILTRALSIDSDTKYVTHDKLIIAYTDDVQIQLSTGYLISVPELRGKCAGSKVLTANFDVSLLSVGEKLSVINGDADDFYYDIDSKYIGYSGVSLTGAKEPAMLSKIHVEPAVFDSLVAWSKNIVGESVISVYDQGYRFLMCLQDDVSFFKFRAVKL